jgi:hypothetical protein
MILHLTPEERKAYNRERQRQRMERYRENKAWKEGQREARYRQIEANIAEVLAENQLLKSGYQRLKAQHDELRDAPPKERIVEVQLPPEPFQPSL